MSRRAACLALIASLLLGLLALSPTAAALADDKLWFACGDEEAVECTWLDVPLDHEDPESRPISLLVKRMPARDPGRRQGVLVAIAGGPGQRGTDIVRTVAHPPALRDVFDIVSWDPRGTSHESLIGCIPEWDPFVGLDRTPDMPAEQEALDRRTAELVHRCLEMHGELLPFMGSAQTAMDLERVRKLLGEPTLNMIGMSYGSQVAVLYATLFPDRVRAMVLDGYSDPNLSPGARELSQAAAFERALDELLADCAADRACPLRRNGDPGRALDQLLMRLDASPIESDTRIENAATQSDAFEAIVGALMRDEIARKLLLEALAEAVDGNGGPLSRIADGIRADYISSGLSLGAFMAISCADTASWWAERTPDEVEDLARRVRDAAPRLGRWLWSPSASADLPPVGLCAMQTHPGAARLDRVNAAATGPILVLATSGDPSTPIATARRAMHAMDGAVMVELERDHHLAYPWAVHEPSSPDYRCVLASVEAYLIDLELPASGRICSR